MKLPFIVAVSLGCAVFLSQAEDKPELKDAKEKLNYSIGLNIGKNLKYQQVDVNLEVLIKGVKDALADSQPLLSEAEVQEALNNHRKEFTTKMQEKRKLDSEKNKKEGDAFLAENAKKPGIVTLPSGLQYQVITEGSGASPKGNDTVVTQYRGTLIDGTEFDSSFKRKQPATFELTKVIAGWTEALQKMKAGAKWQLFVPPNLAYGERGSQNIGPNSTLIFEIELLSVQPAVQQTSQPVTSDIIKVPSAEELKAGAKIEVIKPESIKK
ncbi:MAG: FKBP-type peptidyl-prolyl cis-trans isomerase [Chloroflexi bacterium]|nr:FKBP-type peptidyl-prolyl cis-trans isomerase [Chloroflexota bacterium]